MKMLYDKVSCNCIADDNERDKCLTILPGVTNACCGHGSREQSYIMFSNGVVIRGFDVVEYWDNISDKDMKEVMTCTLLKAQYKKI